jgi:hypothetical protein
MTGGEPAVSGLRRFARPAPQAPGPRVTQPAGQPLGLPRIGQRRRDDAERCELCGEAVPPDHGHLVELEKRTLSCACRGCYLLFTAGGAGRGRYRVVPRRVHHDPAAPLSGPEFDELQVPVSTAFFFVNSALDRVVGCYPSPAGATECELDLAAWDRLAGTHPLLAAVAPDVEAVLVDRTGTDRTGTDRAGADRERGGGAVETFLVPIDLCYALVGRIRMRWSGLDGGDEVRQALADFRADLRARSTPLPRER